MRSPGVEHNRALIQNFNLRNCLNACCSPEYTNGSEDHLLKPCPEGATDDSTCMTLVSFVVGLSSVRLATNEANKVLPTTAQYVS